MLEPPPHIMGVMVMQAANICYGRLSGFESKRCTTISDMSNISRVLSGLSPWINLKVFYDEVPSTPCEVTIGIRIVDHTGTVTSQCLLVLATFASISPAWPRAVINAIIVSVLLMVSTAIALGLSHS